MAAPAGLSGSDHMGGTGPGSQASRHSAAARRPSLPMRICTNVNDRPANSDATFHHILQRSTKGAALNKQAFLAVVVVVGLAGTASATDDAGLHVACHLPPALVTLGGTLPHAAADIGARHGLNIVAFGSSSTHGTRASGPAA